MNQTTGQPLPSLTLDTAGCLLAGHRPALYPPGDGINAAVAFILRETAAGMEGLFIERATRDGDPWSGNISFPGGRVEDHDRSLRETAERETREEISLDLADARYLGRLSDITGAHLKVTVACFVYGISGNPVQPLPNHEVRDLFWVPLDALVDPERRIVASIHFSDRTVTSPAIILKPEKPPLWGITYRLVGEFLQIIGAKAGAAAED
jgi:8-oxo-dGTP pyrophosphatase MutT (NUDIX family)